MSARARKAQRLSQQDLTNPSSPRHSRAGSGTEEFIRRRRSSTPPDDPDHRVESTAGEPYQDFAFLEVGEYLDFDPRPVFVVHARLSESTPDLEPVFVNKALRRNDRLIKAIPFRARPASPPVPSRVPSSDFVAWVKDLQAGARPSSITYAGVEWTGFVVRKRWLVLSGDSSAVEASRFSALAPVAAPVTRGDSPSSIQGQRSEVYAQPVRERKLTGTDLILSTSPLDEKNTSFVTPGTPDWTLKNPVGELSSHVIFARSVDWSATSLGSMESWTPEFRQICNHLMANPHPAALFWSRDLVVMYNKAYAEQVAGNKHPALMSSDFRGPFKELWEFVFDIFAECQKTGKAVAVQEQMLPIERHGFLEETFFTWSLIPLYGGTDTILGLYNAPFETTRHTRAARALKTSIKLGHETATADSISKIWPRILTALEDNQFDFPFAILYSVTDEVEVEADDASSMSLSSESSSIAKSCILEGALGVPEDHPAAPKRLDLKRSRSGFVPYFREAMKTREPKLLDFQDGSVPETLLEGIEWRGFGERCRQAVICPLRPTSGENVIGFLFFGINPRRPFDEDYQSFVQLINRQLATSLASVSLLEAEIRRGMTAQEERSRLSEELAVQRSRLQRIAEVSPVGMFSIDAEGMLLEANDRWFDMTDHPRNTLYPMSWMEMLSESSVPLMEKGWQRLTVDQMPWSGELRLKKAWYDANVGEEIEFWVLAAAQPEFADGQLKTIMGSMTDITLQKRSIKDADTRAKLSEQLLMRTREAEELQSRRLQEAEETRRAQNNFIDITSHEMRNPLSAIIQCADSIMSINTALQDLALETQTDTRIRDAVEESISSAGTIQLCAQHQKSIVDDILTISKLDSNLLVITPSPVQPVNVVQQVLQMFSNECEKMHDIKLGFHVDKSFKELDVDVTMLDSGRLLQILINLMTNAIKFTKDSSPVRTIDVSLSAHLQPPQKELDDFDYFPTKKERPESFTSEDWGDGQVLYLRFEVRDSGCGLTPDEKKRLFNRFAQASPRTHIQYGGSGLGLFISRQLAELQGGEIGVASQAGVGSTFAFYVKARRSETDVGPEALSRLNTDLHLNAPLAIDSSRDLRQQELSAVRQPTEPSDIEVPSSSKESDDPSAWHVLIVEDNVVNQKILAKQLKKLGSVVHVANHGQEALDLIKGTKAYQGREEDGMDLSVILMDLEMPVMDGLTCVRRIREMEAQGLIRQRLPIIAVTANARSEQIQAARDSGMDDVMSKPFRIHQLVPKIGARLKQSVK